jgi:hypothetical protein
MQKIDRGAHMPVDKWSEPKELVIRAAFVCVRGLAKARSVDSSFVCAIISDYGRLTYALAELGLDMCKSMNYTP